MATAAAAAAGTGAAATTFLHQLQQQYLEGSFCDTLISITLSSASTASSSAPASTSATHHPAPSQEGEPPAKRTRGATTTEEGKEEQQQQQSNTSSSSSLPKPAQAITIPCHSNILAASSPYFAAALNGPYVEGQKKVVSIVLVDRQAVEDLRLLIRLCYCPSSSYLQDTDGQFVPKRTIFRLIALADALEFRDFLQACLTSLGREMTMEEATRYVEEIPPGVIGSLRLKIVTTLREGIEKLAKEAKKEENEAAKAVKEEYIRRAGDTLAKVLGCVSDFYEAGPTRKLLYSDPFYVNVPLNAHIRGLSAGTMTVLLRSEALQVTCEDEPYSLLCSWLSQTKINSKMTLYKSLLPHVRFEHISDGFLSSVISYCPFAIKIQETWSYILRRRSVAVDLQGANRGKGTNWKFSTNFSLEELAGLEKDEDVYKYVGMSGGFPTYVNVEHTPDDKLGVYVGVRFAPTGRLMWEGEPERLVSFSYSLTAAEGSALKHSRMDTNDFDGLSSWGKGDFFGKPWQEIVVEGSPYLVDNKLNIELRMEMV